LSGLAELARRDGRHFEAESLMDRALTKLGLSEDVRTDLLARQTTYRIERSKAVVTYARLQLAMGESGLKEGIPGSPIVDEDNEDEDLMILAYPGIIPEAGDTVAKLETPGENAADGASDGTTRDDADTALAGETMTTANGTNAVVDLGSPSTTGTAAVADEALNDARRRELGYSWLGVARLRHESGDRSGALTACTRALPNLDRPIDVVSECGYYALEARDWGPAKVLMTEASDRDPTDAHHFINLGLAYNGLGHMTSAVEAYEQALAMNNRSAEAHIYLGNAYYRMGQMVEAEAAYDVSLTLARDAGVLDRLQQVLTHLDGLRLEREAAAGAAAISELPTEEKGS
jgi:Flp pilus assembly protein TadD